MATSKASKKEKLEQERIIKARRDRIINESQLSPLRKPTLDVLEPGIDDHLEELLDLHDADDSSTDLTTQGEPTDV